MWFDGWGLAGTLSNLFSIQHGMTTEQDLPKLPQWTPEQDNQHQLRFMEKLNTYHKQ